MTGETWPTVPLADLCDPIRGITYGIVKVGDFIPGGVPVIRGGDIRGGCIECDDSKRVTEAVSNQFARTILRGGEIVLNLISDPGHSAVVPPDLAGHNVSRDVAVIPLKVGADVRFIDFFLRSNVAIHWLTARLQGSVTQKINLGTLRELPVSLPPLPEQRAITHILGTLDDKIELNRKTNETLVAMAKALFQSWFVDFDPVRAKVEGSPTGLPDAVSDLFPDSFEESELGEIPTGWKVAPVGDVVECVGGSTPSTSEPDYWEGGEHYWATPKDLSSLSEPFLLDTAKKITAAGVQRISSGILPAGTVLLSSRAPVGYIAVACVPISINQGFIALKAAAGIPTAYLLNWCIENIQQFKDRATGTTFPEISKAAFRPIPLLIPDVPVIQAFAGKTQAIYEAIVANMKEVGLLAKARDSLLPKLISGELRIPEAERMLEEAGV